MDHKGLKSDKKGLQIVLLTKKYLTALSVNRKCFSRFCEYQHQFQIFNADYVLIIAHKPKHISAYEKNPHG